MHQIASHLEEIVSHSLPLLEQISNEEASIKPGPTKWSRKEIIGHLIDSAANNHQKFMRTIATANLEFVGYDQDNWVAAQRYNEADWQGLLHLWVSYNLHLAHIIRNIPVASLAHHISINGTGPFTLEFIVTDYPEHMKHHLKAVLPQASFLENKFRMVY